MLTRQSKNEFYPSSAAHLHKSYLHGVDLYRLQIFYVGTVIADGGVLIVEENENEDGEQEREEDIEND